MPNQRGWFSRRHETSQAHMDAQHAWRAHKSPQARLKRSQERAGVRAALTAEEQIAVLDERLGIGVGAKRERKRLAA